MTLASWHLGESWQQGGQGARLSQLIPPEELPSAPSAAGASTPLTLRAPPSSPQASHSLACCLGLHSPASLFSDFSSLAQGASWRSLA